MPGGILDSGEPAEPLQGDIAKGRKRCVPQNSYVGPDIPDRGISEAGCATTRQVRTLRAALLGGPLAGGYLVSVIIRYLGRQTGLSQLCCGPLSL